MKILDILNFLDSLNIDYDFIGNDNDNVDRYSSINNYKSGTFTWIKSEKYIPEKFNLQSISLCFSSSQINGINNMILTKESKKVFFLAIEKFYGKTKNETEFIGQHTYISSSVKIGKNVYIGHNCSLDGDIIIGDNTTIWNNVVITGNVEIGNNCDIQSGCVIGYENIAYTEDNNHKKTVVRQYGGVKIGNNVTIQALVKIACGTIDDTIIMDDAIIGDGSSISHNCIIEKNVAMLPMSILCGSVHVGENSYLSCAYVRNQIKIGKNAFVGFGSVVVKDVGDNEEVWGYPARSFPLSRE